MCREDKTKTFAFEKSFCLLRSEVWLHEARNLFYSADVLENFERLKQRHLWQRDDSLTNLFCSDLTDRAFFNWRVQRMLWAYGFENLFKCIIVTRYRATHPEANEVPFSEIKSHNLVWLATNAGFRLDETQRFYLAILVRCALWAGRYPLPLREEHMYDQRTPLPSREALLQRHAEALGRHQRGEIPRTFTESDVLHSQMGAEELQVCFGLRNEAIGQAEAMLKDNEARQQGGEQDAASRRPLP